ncbi:Scr1 family TA system antitoxin-like transcriptional regulator [Streptomyces zingiberis]|uniref:Scr1 family TA system antitoxin-like transcriptional regulator n=1 Tax=Streptomyces zingiberis TaxID=2053010 RepID=UPI0035D4E88E
MGPALPRLRPQRDHPPRAPLPASVHPGVGRTGRAHPGKNGAFVVMESREHRHLGYFESQGVGCVVSEPAEVSAFGLRYGKLRSQALNVEESARLIERMVGKT